MNKSIVLFCLLTLTIFLLGCEELLPLRSDPANYLTAKVQSLYVYNTPKENSLYLFLVFKNNYDETLQAQADVAGSFRVKWYPPADYSVSFVNEKNVTLSIKDIYTGNYDSKTGNLTINPGDSLVLGYKWDFVTDDKTDMLLKFGYFVDKSCSVRGYPNPEQQYFRQISEKQIFEITGNARIFTQTAVLYAQPLVINQCFVSHDNGDWDPIFNRCRPINPSNPCSALQPP